MTTTRIAGRSGRVTIASLALLAAAHALGATPDAARACAAIESDAERLACYDKVFRAPVTPDPQASAARPAATTPAATSAPAAETAAPPAKTPVAGKAADDFGYSEAQRTEQARASAPDPQEALKELHARIVELKQQPRGEYVMTLDNGQVWSQKSTDWKVVLAVGDEIVIRRGVSNSYRMRRADG